MKRIYTNLSLALAGAAMFALPIKAETWKSLGVGEWRENGIHAWWNYNSYPEVKVEIEESEQTPGRYRLVNPYKEYPTVPGINNYTLPGDYYVIIDASNPDAVYLESSLTGHIIGSDEDGQNTVMWISSQAYDCFLSTGKLDAAINQGVVGKMRDGYINFPSGAIVSTCIAEDKLDKYIPDFSGAFGWRIATDPYSRVHLPGAAYLQDTEVEFVGISDDLTTLTYAVTFDQDVQSARVALLPGKYDAANVEKIVNGEVPFEEIQSSSNVEFAYPGNGIATAYVVAYYNGKATFDSHHTQELDYMQEDWMKLGEVDYTEAYLSSSEMRDWGVIYDEYTYKVPLEMKVGQFGYFRLKNPYGEVYPYWEADDYDSSQNWYLYIDATDQNRVVIKKSETGYTSNAGLITLWSRADKYIETGFNTPDEVESMDLFGKYDLDNAKITFPEETLLIHFARNPSPDSWYWANLNGHFLIDLSGIDFGGVKDVIDTDSSNAPTEYFTLDGRKANGKNMAPGIYIVRKGNKSYKEVVK